VTLQNAFISHHFYASVRNGSSAQPAWVTWFSFQYRGKKDPEGTPFPEEQPTSFLIDYNRLEPSRGLRLLLSSGVVKVSVTRARMLLVSRFFFYGPSGKHDDSLRTGIREKQPREKIPTPAARTCFHLQKRGHGNQGGEKSVFFHLPKGGKKGTGKPPRTVAHPRDGGKNWLRLPGGNEKKRGCCLPRPSPY